MEDVLTVSCFVVLVVFSPALVAYFLYKKLPPSRIEVEGPWQGLQLNLGGAFAGYFLLVLVANGILIGYYQQKPAYEMWSVVGSLALTPEESSVQDITPVVNPPCPHIDPFNGQVARFTVENVPITKGLSGMETPTLIFLKPGRQPAVIHLDRKPPAFGAEPYVVSFDDRAKKITVETAVPLPPAPPLQSAAFAGGR